MARKNINIGSGINTGTGDTLRNAMSKVNDNFEELYNGVFGGDSSITAITVSTITAPTTNGTLTLAVNGSGDIVIDGNLKVNTISSDDSAAIQINDSINIRGSVTLTTGASVSSILDEDTFLSDSDTALATQQSIKAYVDAQTTSAGSLTIVDDASTTVDINLATDSLTVAGGTGITTAISGDTIIITGLELLDEDNLGSNSETAVASQQSIKAYVDSQITSTNTLTIADDTSSVININLDNTLTVTGGDSITTSVSGQAVTIDLDENITVNQISSTDSTEVQIADNLVPTLDNTYALGSADKKWSALHVAGGSIFLGDLILKDNGNNTLGIFQSDGTTPADVDFSSNITIVGDDSTGVVLNSGETLKIAGAGISTTEVSGDVLTITTTELNDLGASVTWVDVPDANITQSSVTQHQGALSITQSQISDFNSPITIVGDDSTGVTLNTGETIKITGTQNITSTVSGDTLTLTGPDLSSFITASTLEFVGDDSTGTVFDASQGDNVKFAGTNGIAVSVSGDTVTIDGTALAVGGGLTFVGDDSTGTVVSLGETFKIAGTQNITTAVSGDTLTVTGPNLTSYVQNTDAVLTLVGDDSTGTVLNVAETFKIAGTQNITTAVSGDTLTVTGPDLSSYLTDISFRIVGDDSASVEINNNGTILFNGESNITTSTTSDGVVTITGPDISSFITASSSDALTNKTFDANDTGNAITNLEVADFAAGVVDTDLSSVSGADDTLASAKAIVSYVDTSVSQLSQTIQISDDTSTVLTLDLQDDTLSLAGGNSIITAISGDTVTIALDKSIDVNTISSGDSTAIIVNDGIRVEGAANFQSDVEVYGTLHVNNIQGEDSTQLTINQNLDVLGVLRVRELQSEDSTQVLINDGMRIDGALNVQNGAEIYGTLYAQEIGAEDSSQLTFLDPIQVRGLSSTINDLTITTNQTDTVTVSTQNNEKLVLDAENGLIDVIATTTDFTGNVIIEGNLTVQGSETIVNTTTLEVEDNRIIVANNNSADVTDFGFFGHYYSEDSTAPNHAGIWRDATNKEWYFMASYDPEPIPLTIDRSGDSYSSASINALNVTAEGSFIIGSANLNETDITKIDGITNGTITANKALIVDGNRDLSTIANLTSDATITAVTGDYQTIKVNTISSDDSTSVRIEDGLIVTGNFEFDGGVAVNTILDEDGFGSDSATALATQQSIKAYVDAQDANIAFDSLVFTNKTFDANATGNSISNLEVADFAGTAVVTEAEGINSSDNDTSLPTTAAVKDYVDNQIAGNNTLTVADDTSTTIAIELDNTLKVAGGNSLTSSVAGNTVTLALDKSIDVNEISSGDSTAIQINDAVNVLGALFVNGNISSNGTLAGATGSTIGNLTLADGSITSSSGAISFDNENISTTGTVTGATGSQFGNITLANGSITDSSGTISFDDENLTTTGNITAQLLDINTIQSTDSTFVIISDGLSVLGSFGFNDGVNVDRILDEDNMSSDSITALATQQSIKAYVDNSIGAISSTSITEGNSSVVVADSGTGTVTVTLDGGTHTTFDSSGITLATGDFVGNSSTASAWASSRTVTFATGDVTGSFSIDGSGDVSNVALTVANDSVALGTQTTGNFVQQGATSGNGISGSVASEGGTFTVTSNATNANTGSTIVFRDGSGNFSAGTITANLSGTATTATNVTATANNTTNETVYLTFVDGQTGAQGIETDVNLTYNPSTNVISSTAAAAQYSDLAERFEADAEYEQGTVMVIGGDREVTQSTQEGSTDVVGIVSSTTQAGFTMNTDAGTDETHPLIALAGRAQVKVVGPVAKGDRLIASSTPGCARKSNLKECTAFNVIGRALENKTSSDVGTVLCLTLARL